MFRNFFSKCLSQFSRNSGSGGGSDKSSKVVSHFQSEKLSSSHHHHHYPSISSSITTYSPISSFSTSTSTSSFPLYSLAGATQVQHAPRSISPSANSPQPSSSSNSSNSSSHFTSPSSSPSSSFSNPPSPGSSSPQSFKSQPQSQTKPSKKEKMSYSVSYTKEELVDTNQIEKLKQLTWRDSSVSEILREKQDILSIRQDNTVFEAINLLTNKKVGSVLVKDVNGKYVGIFTERDYLNKVAVKGYSSRHLKVSQVMSSPLIIVTDDQSVLSCLQLMTNHRFRHLPVMKKSSNGGESNELIGILSIGDLVKSMIQQCEESMSDLKNYINGGYTTQKYKE